MPNQNNSKQSDRKIPENAPETEKKCETFTSELPEKDDKINGVENQPTFTNDHIPSSQMNEHIQSSQSSGCYVEGWFDNTRAWCCVDTGACSTIMSCNFYHKLPEDQQPQLKPVQGYRSANGSPVQCLGKGMFKFKLGKLELKKALVVAAIVDDVLLGADILQNDPNGRARLLLDEERMILHGNSIPLTLLRKSESFRKVTAANNYIIQGMVEMTVDAYIEDFRDDSNNTAVLIEPSPQLGENLPLIMAPCLVNAVKNTTVTVRLINRSINPISINKDTVLGIASVCTEKPLPQFQKETSDQSRYFEKDEEDTNRDTLPASAEKGIISEEDLEITCEKCENKSEHMSSRLSIHDAENTIRRVPDHALEHKTKTLILKDYTSRSMRQISNMVQWLPKTTIATIIFIFGIIFSYISLIGTQISNKTQVSVWTEGQTHPGIMRNCYKFETRSSTKTKQKEKELEHKTEPPKPPQQKPHKHKKYKDKPGWVINYPHRQEVCASNPATRLQVQDLYDGKSSLVKYEIGNLVWYLALKRKIG